MTKLKLSSWRIPEDLHYAAKIRAAEEKMTLQSWFIRVLREALGKGVE